MDTKTNPANGPVVTEDTRIPMSIPHRKLETPEIPGYHQHWMADRDGRIQQALRAGYQFVEPEDINALNVKQIGSGKSAPTGTDLGTRISMISGGETLYLMKIKKEWFEADQAELARINQEKQGLIMRGQMAVDKEDAEDRGNVGKLRYGHAELGRRKTTF